MAGDHRAAASLLEALLKPAAAARTASSRRSRRPSSRTRATSWRWPIVPWGDRPTPRRCSRAWPRSRPGRSPPTPSSCWARRTSRPADTPRRSRRCERYLAENPRGDVAEFALADLVAAQLGAGRADDAGKTLATAGPPVPRRQGPAAGPAPVRRGRPGRQAVRPRRRAIPPGGRDRPAGTSRVGPDAGGQPPPSIPRSASAPWPAWGMHSRTWAGPPRRPRRSARSWNWPPPIRSRRRWRWPGPARSRPRTGPRTRSPPMPPPPADSPDGTKARARHWPGRGCWRSSVGTSRRPRSIERLLDDPHAARCASTKIGATPDALLAELGWSLVDASKPAEADRVFARLLKEYPDESSCGRRAVQPGGIGQPGAQLRRR